MLTKVNYEPELILFLIWLLMWAAKTAALLILAIGTTLPLRRRSAALRHQIWAATIVTSLLLPLASVALPSWHIWTLQAPSLHAATPTALPITIWSADLDAAPIPAHYTPTDFSGAFLAIAALGTAFVLFRLVVGLVRLARTSAYAKAAPQEWISTLDSLRATMGIGRRVRLLESLNETTMPMTWGVFRPRIILPLGAAKWSADRRRIVLSHELAHIARGDWLFQIAAEILSACFWFNPLAWLAANRLRQESERACDDAVLNSGIAASEYANELLALTQSLSVSSRRFSLALAIARPSNLERRFAAMLNPSINRNPLQRTASLLAILLGTILLLPLATMQLWAQAAQQTTPAVTQSIVALTIAATPSIASATISPADTTTVNVRSTVSTAPMNTAPAHASARTANSASANAEPAAQQTTGNGVANTVASITGVVTDPSGARVPRAVVDLTFESNPLVPSGEVATGQVGEFTFPSLVAGSYSLMIRQPGFQAYTAQHIVLAAGEHLDLHQISLRVGTISQEVSIHAGGATVTTAAAPADCSAPPVMPAAEPKPTQPAAPADPNGPKPPTRIRVGGMVEAAALVCSAPPVYPASARAAGLEGTVILRAIIGKNGVVESLEWTNPGKVDSSLMKAAMDAVKDWRYKPLLLNGEPVEVETEINVVFTLADKSGQAAPSTALTLASLQSAPAPAPAASDLGNQGITILSPTRGVNFTPYLKTLLSQVRAHWYAEMPQQAHRGDKGKVSAVFTVQPKGGLSAAGPVIDASSGLNDFDKAAMDAIRTSLPFAPLPGEFHGPNLKLKLIFAYNEPLNAVSN